MKKLMAILAMVLLAGSSRAMAGLDKITTDGSLEVSGASANNETDLKDGPNDHRGVTSTRVRVGLNTQVTEGVMGRVELTRTPLSAAPNAVYGNGPSSVQSEQGYWLINNAYVDFDNLWTVKARLGRQYAGTAGDLVWSIGPKSDDMMTINSIDGLNLDKTFMEKIGVNIFTGKASTTKAFPTQTDATNANDVNITNVGVKVMNVVPNATVNAAVISGDLNAAATNNNKHLRIYRLGINGGALENMLTYRAEYLQNGGENNNGGSPNNIKYKGNAIDLGVGVNLKDNPSGKWSFAVAYAKASGDDKADTDDKSFHDLNQLGVQSSDRNFGEIFGKSNAMVGGFAKPYGQGLDTGSQGVGLQVASLSAKYVPPIADGKYSAKLDYLMLSRGVDSIGGTDIGKKYGNEIDLTLGYAHSANVGIEAGWAMLQAKEALARDFGYGVNGSVDNVTKWFARTNIKWGGEEK